MCAYVHGVGVAFAGLVGVQTSNWSQSYEDRLPYVNMVTMLLVDTVLYFLLAWYLDKVT